MYNYKIFEKGNENILAIADSEIIGKIFEEGMLKLEVKNDFYGTDKCDNKKIKDLIKGRTIINAVGKNIIKILEEEELIERKMILFVNGIPHVQIITI